MSTVGGGAFMRKNSGTGKKGEKFLVGEGGYGTFIYIDNFSNTKNIYMPMLKTMTSFPTICGPTKTALRDAFWGKAK